MYNIKKKIYSDRIIEKTNSLYYAALSFWWTTETAFTTQQLRSIFITTIMLVLTPNAMYVRMHLV